MQQLAFDLGEFAEPSFGNFAVGANAEALAALRRAASGTPPGEVVYVWGVDGAGKSHLLRSAILGALAAGLRAEFHDLAGEGALGEPHDPRRNPLEDAGPLAHVASGASVSAASLAERPPPSVLALDHVDAAPPDVQATAFTLFNSVRGAGGWVVAAGRTPPRLLPVRDDLRTRLGWGVSLEVLPLTDEEKCAAMVAAAASRGLALGPAVADFLLRHGPRDMRSLLAAVGALDRYSLARHRPLTLPLVRDWLREAGRPGGFPGGAHGA